MVAVVREAPVGLAPVPAVSVVAPGASEEDLVARGASVAVPVDREGVVLSDRMTALANPVVNDDGPTVTMTVPAKNAPVVDAPSVLMTLASRVVRKVAAIARKAVANVVVNVARVVVAWEAVVALVVREAPVDLVVLVEWERGVWNSTR